MQEQESTKNRFYWIVYNSWNALKTTLSGFAKQRPLLTAVVLFFLLALIFINRGGLQPIALFIRKFWLVILIGFVLLRWIFQRWSLKSTKGKLAPSLFLVVFAMFCYFAGPGLYRYLSLYWHYNQLEKIQLAELPPTDFERIQPINSITTLINQEALSETEDATTPKFVRGSNGKYYYSCAVGPAREYKIQQLSKNMYEVLNIPADLPSPVFGGKYRTKVNFNIGELLLFSKRTAIAVIKRFNLLQYFTLEPADPFFVQNNKGKWLQVVPLVKWEGIVLPRPVFGGVFIVDEENEYDHYFKRVTLGEGYFISPERVSSFSYLKGQNLLPKKVSTFIAESFRFKSGFFAPMPFYHEGDIRIPKLSNDVDPQPFITYFKVPNAEKLYNFFGLEPYQEDKKGLSLSLLIAGDNDKTVYFIDHRQSNTSYIGSSAIAAKIIESKKNYDWTKNNPAESRPFVRFVNGKSRFFWLSTIVTKAGEKGEYIGGSIPEITLTDATHGKVVWIDEDSLINNDTWILQAKTELVDYWNKE
jgi:hypothetical protein